MNKKKIIIILLVLLVIASVVTITILFTNKKELKCTLIDNEMTIVNEIIIDKSIYLNVNYTNTYDTMDKVVDTYDIYKKYFKIISKYSGVEHHSIEQKDQMLKYNIKFNLKELDDNSKKLLEVKDIKEFKNIKEFKTYYEKLNYVC